MSFPSLEGSSRQRLETLKTTRETRTWNFPVVKLSDSREQNPEEKSSVQGIDPVWGSSGRGPEAKLREQLDLFDSRLSKEGYQKLASRASFDTGTTTNHWFHPMISLMQKLHKLLSNTRSTTLSSKVLEALDPKKVSVVDRCHYTHYPQGAMKRQFATVLYRTAHSLSLIFKSLIARRIVTARRTS